MYLRYVGKKPWAIDSIGGTGTLWNGNGDIQEVPNEVGEKLLGYPDQWEEVIPQKTAAKAPKGKKAEPIEPEEPFEA